MVKCRKFGYDYMFCRISDYLMQNSPTDLLIDLPSCRNQLENCAYASRLPGLKRYVAEEFADTVYGKVESFLPTKEEQGKCASALGKALKKYVDSDGKRYRIIDFQIETFNALDKAIPGSLQLCSLVDELGSVVANWTDVFQRFKGPRSPRFLHIE